MPSGPLPLVLGVTGHRDLRPEDVPSLEAALLGVIRGLQKQYPDTPMLLLSSLADGADRLGARVAMQAGVELVVPLPMDPTSYERDFVSDASREEFRELLTRARHTIEVPLPRGTHAHVTPTRDELYERAGAFVAATCQILIALWDGNQTGLIGGTGENVRFKLEGIDQRFLPATSPLDPPETGPVIRIVTPRVSGPSVEGAFTVETLYPKIHGVTRTGEVAYEQRVFSRIETFNRDATNLASALASAEKRSAAQLSSMQDSALDPGAASIRRTYAVSDALALHFQRRTREILVTLFVWIFLAAALFETAKGFAELYHPLVGVYATVVVGAAVWYYVTNRGDYRSKFLDYRALAEGLRVQFFWRLGGIREDVASHYLRKQRGELDWIRVAAANANLVASLDKHDGQGGHPVREPTAQELGEVLAQWVQTQYDYYTRAALRDQHQSEQIDLAARWFLAAGIALSVARALTIVLHVGIFETAGEWLSATPLAARLVDIFFTALFIVAALLHNYAEKRALSQQAKQYERMSVMFGACLSRLPPLIDSAHYAQARELIRELGREALGENADWVLLHRERPLELTVRG